jgi:hypothetical protein
MNRCAANSGRFVRVRFILQQIGRMVGRVVTRLSWRTRIQRDFDRDPLQCSRCGEPGMELYSLTVPWRGHLKTFGGLKWLFERCALLDPSQVPRLDARPSPLPPARQLAFDFYAAP